MNSIGNTTIAHPQCPFDNTEQEKKAFGDFCSLQWSGSGMNMASNEARVCLGLNNWQFNYVKNHYGTLKTKYPDCVKKAQQWYIKQCRFYVMQNDDDDDDSSSDDDK